jgi:hypothetical protein
MAQTPYGARPRTARGESLARGLGWFSILFGAAGLAAPRRLARALGLRGREKVLRACGARAVANGVAILRADDPTPWIWGRVAGDAIDIATVAPELEANNPRRKNARMALAAVSGVTALDVVCGRQLRRTARKARARDYSDRSGFPRPAGEMRGAALEDFKPPEDMQTPAALRAYMSEGREL